MTRIKIPQPISGGLLLSYKLISVNPFYAEYAPFERTERCIRISQQVFGRNVVVYQLAYYHRFRQLGIQGKIPLEDYMALTEGERWTDQVELFLMGSAARQLRGFYRTYPAPSGGALVVVAQGDGLYYVPLPSGK